MKLKYREYAFDNGELIQINKLTKLPEDARKSCKGLDVWETPSYWGTWTKICKIDSDITFGTGRKEYQERVD